MSGSKRTQLVVIFYRIIAGIIFLFPANAEIRVANNLLQQIIFCVAMKGYCIVLLALLTVVPGLLQAQRSYAPISVLAGGNWYKIAVKQTGVYKIDVPFLTKLGIATQNLSSTSIRLYGNTERMLPEAASGIKTDDLEENAVEMVDGGDGVFNGNDFFLFYANGPDVWLNDSTNRQFKHQKNLYSKEAYFFVTIGGFGRRISSSIEARPATVKVNSFNERFFHELDSVNFLSSGKQWYGEELSAISGRSSTINFLVPTPNIIVTAPATLVSSCIGRSIGIPGKIGVSINGSTLFHHNIPATGNTNLDLFAQTSTSNTLFTPAPTLNLSYTFIEGAINAQSWINWWEIFCRRSLIMNSGQPLFFRDWNSVGVGNIAGFELQDATASIRDVWDITLATQPVKMKTTLRGGVVQFTNDASRLREYVALTNTFLIPEAKGRIPSQNLHGSSLAPLLIITDASLLAQARQIAQFHLEKDNLRSIVATTNEIYNEFGGGMADPASIRDFVKMFFDRAGADTLLRPRYLLLLGDASFDYKNRIRNNSNLVPAYESEVSLDPLATYTSDDFFGFLEDGEDINASNTINTLDIGIGRVPAQTPAQAQAFIEKLKRYCSEKSFGAWRNEQTYVADDEDFNLHFTDAEIITKAAKTANPLFLQEKLYLDAYQQESNTAGSRYPQVNQANANRIQNGTLIWNYSGHGGFRRLAEEVILEEAIANEWKNEYRLPLFITATCDFAPFDNPLIYSLGENILLRPNTGAIALMTTTRLVFAFSNRIMNRNYLEQALAPKPGGIYLSLGEAVKQAKNVTYLSQGDVVNNRKFTLLGDPALTLAFPRHRVQTTAINGKTITAIPDTLKALGSYTISGSINNVAGTLLNNYNGIIYVKVYDKPQTITTRGNDAGSNSENFQVQRSLLFKGKAMVEKGLFNIDFIVPKDINYQLGFGTISYYTENGREDGNGVFNNFITGGSSEPSLDDTGPQLKAFLNDEKFLNGGLVNEQPILFVKLSDLSGINITGAGIGHDFTAVLDNDPKYTFLLNEFFEADTGTYQQGTARFQLPALKEGPHRLVIKAWDGANNSTEIAIEFIVRKSENFVLNRVINYPNPFTTNTRFWFEHNRPGETLRAQLRIFSITGKLIKTIRHTIISSGSRYCELEWNGTDDYGDRLARGVYIYELRVTTSDNKTAVKIEKLMIL
jgi:hypothetical protein